MSLSRRSRRVSLTSGGLLTRSHLLSATLRSMTSFVVSLVSEKGMDLGSPFVSFFVASSLENRTLISRFPSSPQTMASTELEAGLVSSRTEIESLSILTPSSFPIILCFHPHFR